MRFLNLQANNFLSFREFDYVFPSSGLYFIGGKVVGNETTSSNGAGKSAFFEALSWVLYGKTVRNSAKDKIVKREVGKDCSVRLIFEDDEEIGYVIERYRQHSEFQNSLRMFKDGEEITGSDVFATQESIDSVIGMSWLVFSTAVVFGEKAKRFIEAGDVEKKQIFDEILLLHAYQDAQKNVKTDLNDLLSTRDEHVNSVSQLNSVIALLGAELEEVDFSFKELESERKSQAERVEKKKAEILDIDEQLKIAKGAQGESESDLRLLKDENKKLLDSVNELRQEEITEVNKIKEESVRIRTKISPLDETIYNIEKWLENKDNLPKGDRCPTCGSVINTESIEDVEKHYNKELKTLIPKRDELNSALEKLGKEERETSDKWQGKMRSAEKAKSELDEEIDKLEDIYRAASNDIIRFEGAVESIQKDVNYLEEDYKKRKEELKRNKERLNGKLSERKKKIKTVNKEIYEMENEGKYLSFWIEGFSGKGIKSLLLDEVLPQLNSKASEYGSVLLGDFLRIEFDTLSKLKSGDVRDKFSVKLVSEKEEIDYEECSAGEKRRVDVAVLLALQSLVFDRNVNRCNLSIFDEVFDTLDRVGIERVSTLLDEESEDKLIYVISHLSELGDYFKNVLFVEKKNGESRLLEE